MTTVTVDPGDNLQSIADGLQSGDTLLLGSGLHYGRLDVKVDGITIAGDTGAYLEGTDELPDNNWVLATESDDFCSLAGQNVWKVSSPSNVWMLLDENSNQLFRLDYHYCRVKEPHNYYMTAFQAMIIPDNARPGPDYNADWWNGLEAMFVWDQQTNQLFVKYRDGRKPGRLRWSGGLNSHQDYPNPQSTCIYAQGRKGIRIEGLSLRGAFHNVGIRGCDDIEIEGCEFTSFDIGIKVLDTCNNIKIHDNYFNLSALGTNRFPPVSKSSAENPYPEERAITYHVYAAYKFWHDRSDSTNGCATSVWNGWDEANNRMLAPKNVEFSYNHVEHCTYAIDCFGGDGVDIHHNDVNNMIDMPFQRSDGGSRNIKVHDNETHEAGYQLMRWHKPEQEAGDNYIYNNKSSDLNLVGCFLCFSGYQNPPVPSALRLWIYHNSFSGGNETDQVVGVSSMDGLNYLNNIMSLGLSGLHGLDAHNYKGSPIWVTDHIERDFVIPANHPAKEGGIDISKPFVINGKTYEALPGFEPGYFLGAAPDIGYIMREEPPVPEEPTLTTDKVEVLPGGEVVVEWTDAPEPTSWIGMYLLGALDDDYLDWIYVNGQSEPGDLVAEGSHTFTMPSDEADYEFRLYQNGDGYIVVARTDTVSVASEEPEPEPEPGGERTFEIAFQGTMTVKEVLSKSALKKIDVKVKSGGKSKKSGKKGKK